MPQIPFTIGEASCFKEDIGRKHFWYLPARKSHEVKTCGHLFGVTETVAEDGNNINDVLDIYYENAEKLKPRMALKKAVVDGNLLGGFVLAVVHNRMIYFAMHTDMSVLLMRKEELRYLNDPETGVTEGMGDIIFGEYPVMGNDRIVFCSREVPEALDVREITDILCEYEENIAAQELLKKTLERTTDDRVMVMAVRVNSTQKSSGIAVVRMGLVLVVIAAIIYGIYRLLFADPGIPLPEDPGKKKNTNDPIEQKTKNSEYIKKLEGKLPLSSRVLWEKTYASITSSPVVHEGVLYIAAKDSKLRAITMATREEAWTADMAYEMGGTPAVDASGVFIGTYKGVEYKLSLLDGSIVWRGTTGKKIVAGTSLSESAVFTGSTDNYVYAFKKDTGERLWRVATKGTVWGTPVFNGTTVFAGSLDKSFYAIDAATGKLVWRKQFRSAVYSSPAVSGTAVFVGTSNGSLLALDTATGNELWVFVAPKGVNGRIYADDMSVYFGCDDGNIYVVDAKTGAVRWTYKTNAEVLGGVAVADGILYAVSYDTFVYALDASNGTLLWKAQMSDKIYATPLVSGSGLVVADMKGLVRVFETDLKKLHVGTP